jgi:hypothetical protein
MKPSLASRTKRNTAFVVLLVWLFSLASGAANACLIQAEEVHGRGNRVANFYSLAVEEEHTISAVQEDTTLHNGSGLEASKSQCLNVCDDGSQSFPKQQFGFDSTPADLTPLLVIVWTTAISAVSARGLAVIRRPPDPGFPLRTRLSRLAL